MELKRTRNPSIKRDVVALNRTNVELKHFLHAMNYSVGNTLNRTNVELKLAYCIEDENERYPLNRTNVELKH